MAGASGSAAGARVAIIGGGLAGLHAARLLQSEGVAFRILEARDRRGGCILSVDAAGRVSADGFDLGPSWFWPELHPAMAATMAEYDRLMNVNVKGVFSIQAVLLLIPEGGSIVLPR
jgi:monoamine oxidase